MRSVRPSLSIALFVGSVAALACGGGDDDDGNRPLQTTDAAVVATQGGGATTGGVGAMDAGFAANPTNPLANLDASGLINAALDSGLITTNPDGGIGINQGAICMVAPMYCVDGSLSIPRGDGGVRTGGTGGTGGTAGLGGLAGLAGGTGGLAGLAGGLGGLAGLAGGLGGLAGLAGLAGGAGGAAAGAGGTAP